MKYWADIMQGGLVVSLVCLPIVTGCVSRHYGCPPRALLSDQTHIDLSAATVTDSQFDHHVLQTLTAPLREEVINEVSTEIGSPKNFLALSGGGCHGAYSVGILNGWTVTGIRPEFDTVTGVSTGALIATYAFLGSAYDAELCRLYTETTSSEIYRRRTCAMLIGVDSVASSDPLKRQIERQITPKVLQQVATAYLCGRRLYIGTTNLDTGRLVIWDMGAIAASGRPDALELYRTVVLSSTSVPGFFPPVPIHITVNGQPYTELYVDGSATAEVFLRASMLHMEPSMIQPGRLPLVSSNAYIIIAGKMYPEPDCVKRRALKIVGKSLAALTSAQTRADVARIYTLSLLTGMQLHVAAIPEKFPADKDSLNFDPFKMRQLYEEGYRLAASNQAWRNTPQVVDPSQQSLPRAGTNFYVPSELMEVMAGKKQKEKFFP